MSDENVLREIQRETRERLDVLEIDRLDVAAKRAKEEAAVGDASRVEFSERDWRKRRPETLDEIKRIVDAMGTPREERLKVGERVFLPPAEPLPPTRALTDLERKAIDAHLGGKVARASIIYRSSRGHVVEVEHDKDGRKETTLLSVLGERVRDLGDIRSRIDAFDPKGAKEEVQPPPAPVAEPVAETPVEPVAEPAPQAVEAEAVTPVEVKAPLPPESAPAAPEPKKRFAMPSFGKKKAETEAPTEEPAGEKKRFSMPKFGKKKDAPEADAAPAPEEAPKKRFALPKFGKKDDAAPPSLAEAPAEPAAEGKGISRFLKRKKDA